MYLAAQGRGRQGQEEGRLFTIQLVLGHRGVTGNKHLQNQKSPCGLSALHTRGCPAWAECAQRSEMVFRSTEPPRAVQDRATAHSAVTLWPAAFSERFVRSSSRNAFLYVSA